MQRRGAAVGGRALTRALLLVGLAWAAGAPSAIGTTGSGFTTLAVTFANGTQQALKYSLPPADIVAAAAAGASPAATGACCKPLVGEVASFNASFALFGSAGCAPAAKLCSFPAAAKAVWVCGCPGGRCYGQANVESRSDLIGWADPSAALHVSSDVLYRTYGPPTRVQLFSAPPPGAAPAPTPSPPPAQPAAPGPPSPPAAGGPPPCAVRGVRLEYAGGAVAVGQSGGELRAAQLGNLTSDPVVSVAYQTAGCLSYLELRTKAGRVLQAGAINKAYSMRRLAGRIPGSALAGLAGYSQPVPGSLAARGPLLALRLLWGYSHCPAVFGRPPGGAGASEEGAEVEVVSLPASLRVDLLAAARAPAAAVAAPASMAAAAAAAPLAPPPAVAVAAAPAAGAGSGVAAAAAKVAAANAAATAAALQQEQQRLMVDQAQVAAPLPTTAFATCGNADPFCFTDDDCYCRLPNGTYGAACPMFGSCFGACCATTGACPDRMGYEDPETGAQSVLLPRSCADWGVDTAGAVAPPAAAGAAGFSAALECRLPRGRSCDPRVPGTLCTGYTACRGREVCDGSLNGAMCVFRPDTSSRFDVCSCLPIFPMVDPDDAASMQEQRRRRRRRL